MNMKKLREMLENMIERAVGDMSELQWVFLSRAVTAICTVAILAILMAEGVIST